MRGPAAIAMLCLRCAAVLAGVAFLTGVVAALAGGGGDAVPLACLVALVGVVPIAVVGFPVGLGLAQLLRRVDHEWVHVAAFALVGGAVGAALLAAADWVLLGLALGVVSAGGARWWTGWAHRRVATRPPRPRRVEPEDLLIDAADGRE